MGFEFALYDALMSIDVPAGWRGTAANVRYTFDSDLVLSSVTGWARTHTNNNFDRNGSSPEFNRFDSQGVFELYSQEFNLISPDNDGPFSYVAGVFYQHTENEIFDWRNEGFNIYLTPDYAYPFITLDTPYLKKEDEYSAFVDLKYALTENWEAELGVRYSKFELWSDINVVLLTNLTDPPTYGVTVFAGKQR
jgi:iron complex outermembrane recepter protein